MDGLCQTRGVDQQSEKAPGVAGWCLHPLKGSAAAERKDKEAGSRKAGGHGGSSLSWNEERRAAPIIFITQHRERAQTGN